MGNKSIIELNGKRYDAVSGKLLDATRISNLVKPTKKVLQDIMVRPSSSVHSPRVKKPVARAISKAIDQDFAGRTKKIVAPHRPQHTKTLARKAVRKPDIQPKKIKHVSPSTSSIISTIRHLPAETKLAIDEKRLARAQMIGKSNSVSRFGRENREFFTKKIEPIPVKHPPTSHPIKKASAGISNTKSVTAKSNPLEIFAAGLARADSHKLKPLTKAQVRRNNNNYWYKRKAFYIASAIVIIFIISGFVFYQNIPRVNLDIASSRAGMSAEFPGYKPASFKITSPIRYQPGSVTIIYKSTKGTGNYTITQQVSNWDDTSLEENVLSNMNNHFTTIQNKGRTIYLYDNVATWVSNGIWYKITNNANLTQSQIINIISAL